MSRCGRREHQAAKKDDAEESAEAQRFKKASGKRC